ncbi:dihydrofolate reductase family protein [Mumia quercus]|uniref:dihydrofolate reductase family protein n=1 Tax=Mumia quercus TaxID=2976125 RepID=UPI0021CE72AA|nr:dihydrofolate reductase family protein [Mumia quercus]
MAALIYVTNMSLDGYIEDENGDFALYPHDDEVFMTYTDLVGSVGTFLYGRRLYETMAPWETDASLAAQSPLTAEFATVWQDTDKVVYSTTLSEVATARTRVERRFDAASVREIVASATNDLTVGGADLAAQAFAAGLVDECHLFVWPWIIGGGKSALPSGLRTELTLLEERRFANGVLQLRYRIGA